MVWIVAIVALLNGCATNGTIEMASKAEPDYAIVKTFFATDRNLTGKTKPDEMFGASRSNITYGT
ncbi:MAG: hypothetical protein KGJ14_05960, partial [Nitrospirota bacterium]|nr:hypothetical protein [Nitrospirota bacterium]